jgi:hypothetical protein
MVTRIASGMSSNLFTFANNIVKGCRVSRSRLSERHTTGAETQDI